MRLDTIQALRGLAAYLVLFYHIAAMERSAIAALGTDESPLVGGIFRNGYAGVDLFFVISGFIMVYVTAKRPENLATVRDFFLARLYRILPPWWLFAGIMAFYLYLTYGVPWDAEALERTGNTGLNYIIRSFLLLPQPNFPVLGVGWTLVHEMYFYVGFALILLFPRRFLPLLLLLWGGAVVIGASFGLTNVYANDFVGLAFYLMTLEFIAGALVGWAFVKGFRPFPGIAFLLGLVSFLVVLAVLPPYVPNLLTWGRVAAFTLPCALMVYGAAGLQARLGHGWVARTMTRLGDWSFALYLSHMIVLSGLRKGLPLLAGILERRFGLSPEATGFLRLGTEGYLDNVFYILVAVILSTMAAAFAFYAFERPVLRMFNALRQRRTDLVKAW